MSLKTYAEPLRTLKSSEVSKALRKILKKLKVTHLRSDAGGEFLGESKKVYEEFKIKHYVNRTSQKALLAEARIKFLKRKLNKMMYAHNNRKWAKFLPAVVKSINQSASTKLAGFSPDEVESKFSSAELYQLRYHNRHNSENKKNKSCLRKYKKYKKEYKFDLGSVVRLTKVKQPFQREYSSSNTSELFLISTRKKMDNISMYTVKSLSVEDLEGYFYDDEISLVCGPLRKYKIKEILDTKVTSSGDKYLKVHWSDYPKSQATWLLESELADVSYFK